MRVSALNSRAALLAAYDAQLREDETPSAISVVQHGPLRLVTFAAGRGFVTYQNLGGEDADRIRELVAEVLGHYRRDPGISRVEWKTRGHDHAPGLHEALLDNGFVPEEPKSIMIGEARLLAVDIELPAGLTLRRVTTEPDVRSMSAMSDLAFDEPVSDERADSLLRRLSVDDSMELWVAEAGGQIVSAGRLEPVPNSDFAGIWDGSRLVGSAL